MSIVRRGDTHYWRIPVVDAAGQPYNLANCVLWVTVKRATADADAQAVYQQWVGFNATGVATTGGTAAGGGAHTPMTLDAGGLAGGVVIQRLDQSVASNLAAGAYTYDVQIMLANGDIHTPLSNQTETVIEDITRATTRPA